MAWRRKAHLDSKQTQAFLCSSPSPNSQCYKYTIKGKTDHQPRLDAWDKCSGLVHWEDPEGWDGEGGGRGNQDREHM